jgi:hypothetical protein
VNSFVTALQPALMVPAVAFAIGALSCFLIATRRSTVAAPLAAPSLAEKEA